MDTGPLVSPRLRAFYALRPDVRSRVMTVLAATGQNAANFDFAGLAEIAAEARAGADRIRAFGRQLDKVIVAIGTELIDIKEKLGHGHFGDWLKAEFGMSPDTDGRYMRVIRVFGDKIRTVRFLKPTTPYVLTAKATPEAVRDEVIARIEAGEQVSDSEGRAVIETAKTGRKEVTPPERKSFPTPPSNSAGSFAQTRGVLARGYLHALGVTVADLQPIE